MRSKRFLLAICLALLNVKAAQAASCLGRGTAIFYGNGMFNSKKDAELSLSHLMVFVRESGLSDPTKELTSHLAYKRSEPILEQLMNVALQKEVTDFERFWAWLDSLEVGPAWFQDQMKVLTVSAYKVDSAAFGDLEEHFERYAKSLRDGYNVILVSHSQGNLFANQAMIKFASYTDGSLTGSIQKKEQLNPQFPQFFDLFANVQVATPVSGTINSSPWTTFKDDLVMAALREAIGALPANIQSSGVGLPPSGDSLGHNFIKAYLRADESRTKILADIKTAYGKLRYPIAYFQPALTIVHPNPTRDTGTTDLSFEIRSPSGEEYGEGHDEEWPNPKLQVEKDFVSCFSLKLGDSRIIAQSIVDGMHSYDFTYTTWPEGGIDRSKEKPVEVHLPAKRGVTYWDVGVIHTKAGSGREPLDVQVEIYPAPRPRGA